MLVLIVRILFILAAPFAALLVSRDALNFSFVQTMVAMILMTGFVGLLAALIGRERHDASHVREAGSDTPHG
jgi:hypothetical protein